MSAPELCLTCGGHGMIGGWEGSGNDMSPVGYPCPDCAVATGDAARIAELEREEWSYRESLIAACANAEKRIAELERQLAEARAWQEEIRGAIDRSGMGIMRTSQGPSGTLLGYRPEVEEEHDRKTLEVIHENVDLSVEVKNLRAQLAASEKDKAQRHRTMADAKTLLQLIECKCDSATYGNFVCPRCVTISNLDATMEAR